MSNTPNQKILKGKETLALELKWKGYKYEEIAKRTGFSKSWIKQCFYKEGSLFKKYQDYEKEQNRREQEMAMQILKSNLRNAILTYVKELQSEDSSVRIRAAEKIIDRCMGKVPDKLEGDILHKHVDMLELFKMLPNGQPTADQDKIEQG